LERLEIIDTGRRRRFSRELKLQIVAESFSEPGLCATTARRYGISRSQLYEWRRLARTGKLDVGGCVGGFIPALVMPEPAMPVEAAPPSGGRMEVVIANGRRVIVDGQVDVEALLRVVRGLEGLR
jgi:transposase